jgi:PAS domain S-box-containing protein
MRSGGPQDHNDERTHAPVHVRLLPVLSAHREAITTDWERAIAHTSYVPLSPASVHERLAEWVDRLVALLCMDRLDKGATQAIGGALAQLFYGHPETLSRTLEALGSGLTTGVSIEDVAAVQRPLMALLGELAAGFLSQSRATVLTEQETIRTALLTARQQAQEALRESEARFRALFEAAAIGIGIGDLSGRILETNPALQQLLGYSADELRHRVVADFMHPDDLQAVWQAYQDLVTGQHDYFELEKPFYRKDGQSIWTHLTLSLVRGAEGGPQLQIAMIEDVTQRKQAEETVKRLNADLERRVLERTAQLSALNQELADEIAKRSAVEAERLQLLAQAQAARADAEAAQQRLAFLAEASGVLASSLDYKTTLSSVARLAVPHLADWCAVDVVGESGAIHRLAVAHVDLAKVEAVRALEGHHPSRPDALSGVRPVLESGRPEFLPQIAEALATCDDSDDQSQTLLHQLKPHARMTVPLLSRERPLGAITFALVESHRQYTLEDLALAEDLARRAALAIENARLYREAQEALAARDEFLSVAAHELKTPITSVRGFAQLTLRALERPEGLDRQRLRQALTVVNSQSVKLTHLVSQLLDVSRIQSGRLALNCQDMDLSRLAAEIVGNMQHQSERHRLVLHAPAEAAIWADPLRIEQVVTNLLDNAIKFSPEGGAIEVNVDVEPGAARLAVRDHGIGIPPEHRGQIFERFYQAEAAAMKHAAGMGLGLYISRQIVELHHGRIAAEFPPDGGTRFVIALPSGADRGACGE